MTELSVQQSFILLCMLHIRSVSGLGCEVMRRIVVQA